MVAREHKPIFSFFLTKDLPNIFFQFVTWFIGIIIKIKVEKVVAQKSSRSVCHYQQSSPIPTCMAQETIYNQISKTFFMLSGYL